MEYFGVKIDTSTMSYEELLKARRNAYSLLSQRSFEKYRKEINAICAELDFHLSLRRTYAHKNSS